MSIVEADRVRAKPKLETAPLIVHVVRQFLPNRGGLEDVVANLARQTVRRGYRVRVVTRTDEFELTLRTPVSIARATRSARAPSRVQIDPESP